MIHKTPKKYRKDKRKYLNHKKRYMRFKTLEKKYLKKGDFHNAKLCKLFAGGEAFLANSLVKKLLQETDNYKTRKRKSYYINSQVGKSK